MQEDLGGRSKPLETRGSSGRDGLKRPLTLHTLNRCRIVSLGFVFCLFGFISSWVIGSVCESIILTAVQIGERELSVTTKKTPKKEKTCIFILAKIWPQCRLKKL